MNQIKGKCNNCNDGLIITYLAYRGETEGKNIYLTHCSNKNCENEIKKLPTILYPNTTLRKQI